MKVLETIKVDNFYSGSNWDFERTTKYIIDLDGIQIEAGYFEHYKGNTFVKAVIELPQSYGCPSKCRFCASAAIEGCHLLDADTLEEMFYYIYQDNNLQKQQYVLLTMTGMGDIFFNYKNVELFLKRIKDTKNLYVTLSSCLWNVDLLKKVHGLSKYISIRNVQITFITDDNEILSRIIPYYQSKEYQMREVLDYIKTSEEQYYRVNYIMIKNINDSEEIFRRFCNLLNEVKDKVIVRISKLNETKATKRNQLQSTDINKLEMLQKSLQKENIKSYIFYAHKNDNMNCGQLITER